MSAKKTKPRPKLPASGGSWAREGSKLTPVEKPTAPAAKAKPEAAAPEAPAAATPAPAKKEA